MAVINLRVGVPQVKLSRSNGVSVPSLSTLVFDCSAVSPGDSLLSSIRKPLAAATNYQFMLALVGIDATNGGYTVGTGSPGGGILTVTSGQGVKIHVANGAWPANFDSSICLAIFGKKGSASTWTLFDMAYIDTGADFNFLVTCDPAPASPSGFSTALVQSASSDAVLGNRAPIGVTYDVLGPTTGGVQIQRSVSTASISPDSSPDFTIRTSQASNINFSTLPNGIKDVVRAIGGNYSQFTGDNASTITQSLQTILTASAVLQGNKSIILNMPADATGTSETRLYIGNLTNNQSESTENWQKAAATPIQFSLQTAALDSLLISGFCELIYKRQ